MAFQLDILIESVVLLDNCRIGKISEEHLRLAIKDLIVLESRHKVDNRVGDLLSRGLLVKTISQEPGEPFVQDLIG